MRNQYRLMEEQPYDGDILECALNSGVFFAARKYGVAKEHVEELVRKFSDECYINEPCSCEKDNLQGFTTMCFFCDKTPRRF